MGTPAETLGVNPIGRVPKEYSPSQISDGLRSTAADIVDTWTTGEPHYAPGGGIQYFVPDKGVMNEVLGSGSTSSAAGLVQAETSALQRIAANNRAPTPWADLRSAYEQVRGQVDFAHIEADVAFKANGQVKAQGGHFSTSPQLQRIPGTETVSPNGVIYGQVNLLGPNGNFYLKTNNGGLSSMTPDSWSLARAKGEMSQAWVNRALNPTGNWTGMSSGVEFTFHPPTKKTPQWRGYPVQP